MIMLLSIQLGSRATYPSSLGNFSATRKARSSCQIAHVSMCSPGLFRLQVSTSNYPLVYAEFKSPQSRGLGDYKVHFFK